MDNMQFLHTPAQFLLSISRVHTYSTGVGRDVPFKCKQPNDIYFVSYTIIDSTDWLTFDRL